MLSPRASWKENIQKTDVSRVAPSELLPSLLLPSTKIAYSTILGKSYSVPAAESKILNYGFSTNNIQNVYILPFQILNEPKLIISSLKSFITSYPRNLVSLFRAGIKYSDLCPLCNSESQSLSYMLFSCHHSSSFWNQFRNK